MPGPRKRAPPGLRCRLRTDAEGAGSALGTAGERGCRLRLRPLLHSRPPRRASALVPCRLQVVASRGEKENAADYETSGRFAAGGAECGEGIVPPPRRVEEMMRADRPASFK